jgi:hypothetical protein
MGRSRPIKHKFAQPMTLIAVPVLTTVEETTAIIRKEKIMKIMQIIRTKVDTEISRDTDMPQIAVSVIRMVLAALATIKTKPWLSRTLPPTALQLYVWKPHSGRTTGVVSLHRKSVAPPRF